MSRQKECVDASESRRCCQCSGGVKLIMGLVTTEQAPPAPIASWAQGKPCLLWQQTLPWCLVGRRERGGGGERYRGERVRGRERETDREWERKKEREGERLSTHRDDLPLRLLRAERDRV
jgi:hypothetical protein